MLRLTDCLRTDVIDADGARIGRLVDITGRLDDPYPVVTRLKVKTPDRSIRYVPWRAVAKFGAGGTQLKVRSAELEATRDPRGLHTDELLLLEHVLDTQIIDTNGKRVVRVGEIELAREHDDLLVAGVEVGRAALARRLGLHRFAARIPPQILDWRDLHIASGRGHALQLRTPSARVHRLSASELEHVISRLPVGHAADVLRTVDPETAAGALGAVHPDLRSRLIGELDPKEPVVIEADMREAAPATTASPVRRWFGKVLSVRRRAPS
jgi:sporulation protein YlmC with PRC-barrel domain